ncbi:hypothetical protein [Mycolicibacterium vaccae]|uniref:hypothetical protein n=1 Tax=Mycolicibacterium vaccae TaxID=1810 RepID=UPI003CFC92B9
MRSLKLWQRNVIGAVVTAVALAVGTVTDLVPKWEVYRASVHPATVAGPRQSVTVDDMTWSLGTIRHLGRTVTPFGAPLPEGTVVTVVTVQRDGAAGPQLGCGGVLTDGRHRWRGQSVAEFGLRPLAGGAPTCTAAGALEWAFLIPGDVVPTAVDVTTLDGSILLRLQL